MRLKTSDKLIADFPHAFSKLRYVEVGEGWAQLIAQMAMLMEMPWQHPETAPWAYFGQIKEKLGGIRLYFECEPKSFEDFLKDWKPAVKRITKMGYMKYRDDLQGEPSEAYVKYLQGCERWKHKLLGAEQVLEGMSWSICEECGSTIKVKRYTYGGWIKTHCKECHRDYAKNRGKRWNSRETKEILKRLADEKKRRV
jgi:hypothetical protein